MNAYTAAVVLLDQYNVTRDADLLVQARAAIGSALEFGDDDPQVHLFHAQSGNILQTEAGRSQEPADFEAATTALTRAIDLLPPGHGARSGHLHDRAGVLGDWHQVQPGRGLLVAAERDLREALQGLPREDISYGVALNGLGQILLLRYAHSGDVSCLDHAFGCFREAEPTAPAGDPFRQVVLTHLGNALLDRHGIGRDTARRRRDLDEALVAYEAAVKAAPDEHGNLSVQIGNLASAHRALYQETKDIEALRDAEAGYREILRRFAKNLDTPDRDRTLFNLALTLLDRVGADNAGQAALDEAEALLRDIHRRWSDERVDATAAVFALADCLRTRSERSGDPAPRREAIGLLRGVVTGAAHVPDARRARGAVAWATYAAADGDWRGAVTAYELALAAVDQAASPALDRRSRERVAADFFGLASDAAACALQAGDPAHAVELLEQGRSILLDRAWESRTVLDDLSRHLPRTTGRFVELSRRLHDREAASAGSEQRARWAEERAGLLRTIRELPLFADFLQPPAFQGLADGIGDRTVIVLNVSRIRCDAVLIARGGIRVCPLPSLTANTLIRQTARFRAAVRTAGDSQAPLNERQFAERTTVPAVLRWLWHSTVAPALTGFGLAGPRAPGGVLPRVWWCPTGLLSFLPLHAAGSHPFDRGVGANAAGGRAGNGPAGEGSVGDGSVGDGSPAGGTPAGGTLDHVVSSYTPTVRALAALAGRTASADPPAARPGTPRLLAVAPQAPGTEPLPHAVAELTRIRRTRPLGADLIGPAATRQRVLDELPGHSWFHFAGHAVQDPLAPDAAAGLLPYDYLPTRRLLEATDIADLPLDGPELAFLSACETASGTMDLADEVAHLAGAFLVAGFRHVIGTQWTVRDRSAAHVAADFHRLATDADRSARALHEAVRSARDEAASPFVWGPFVHFGP
nr:CHAT domain-containing protein [Streptomyces sp. SID4948]